MSSRPQKCTSHLGIGLVLAWIYEGNNYGWIKWGNEGTRKYPPRDPSWDRSEYYTSRTSLEKRTGWAFPQHPVLTHDNPHCKKDFPMGRLAYDIQSSIGGGEPRHRGALIGTRPFHLLPGTYEWRTTTAKGAPEDPTYTAKGWSGTCTITAGGETHRLHYDSTLRIAIQLNENVSIVSCYQGFLKRVGD